MRTRFFCLIAGFAVSLASAGAAATLHNVSVVASCGVEPPDSETVTLSTTGISLNANAGTGPAGACGASAIASANAGTVRAQALVANPGFDNVQQQNNGRATASASVTYQFTLRSDFIGVAPVPISINLHATGSVSATSTALFNDQGSLLNGGQRTSASLRAFGAISDGALSYTFEERISVSANVGDSEFDSLSGSITTPKVLLRPGETGSISFGLASSASGLLAGLEAVGFANGGNSVSFALEGDVFNLPDGYFIDIDEPRIANNRYSRADTPSPVPLPASAWFLAIGLVGLRTLRKRAKR
ncbi:hypothetical protein E4Z66_11105 [Aliishimia ponticola]|uniref:VPLPA-CTERM sorting domain-containing protein n=1 Tax=Aliishimia ponticola TaxID=2499833 RepID=A0A4V3XKM4_9RHOB|nr:VPLPA-CTERM sorting domain-containing protein [Aliishimia ponticola]THH37443.1 hypothetical protein E4Z66_11105 [Aliishimia ponticola]